MLKKKNNSKNDFVNFYYSCVLFKKYSQYNLWLGNLGEYDNVKYCKNYIQKYLYYWIFFYLLKRFSLCFVILFYKSPCFTKFVESGFLKYLDYHFLLLFYNNCFTFDSKGKQNIKVFVKLYFQKFLKIRLKKDLLILVNKVINKTILNSFKKYLINRFKNTHVYMEQSRLNDKIIFKLIVNKKGYYKSCFVDLNYMYIIKSPYSFFSLEIICKSLLTLINFRDKKVLKPIKVDKFIMEKTFIEFPRKPLQGSNKDIQHLIECVQSLDNFKCPQKDIDLYKSVSVLFVDSLIQNHLLFKNSFKNLKLFKKSLKIFFFKYKCKRKFYPKFSR